MEKVDSSTVLDARAYSPTRFSKKFVLPSHEIISMKEKGLADW